MDCRRLSSVQSLMTTTFGRSSSILRQKRGEGGVILTSCAWLFETAAMDGGTLERA
jgi:hypothetical protein